jgi:uncharacterized integral membrane protein (TIGR00698 family)
MNLNQVKRMRDRAKRITPGLALTATVALAAMFLAERFGPPLMLMGLLLGMAFSFTAKQEPSTAGIDLASSRILRIGVALLGARVDLKQLAVLGEISVLVAVTGVVLTIAFGAVSAKYFGMSRRFGIISGGAVGICGASAALAISAALPPNPNAAREAAMVVIGVTALSTLAMVTYPGFTAGLGWNDPTAGFFFGATIHDVAQVVGAGYSVSPEAGDFATITKLSRVLILVPVVAALTIIFRRKGNGTNRLVMPVPAFLLGFLLLMTSNSLGFVPKEVTAALGHVSQFCLVVAVTALGMKTSFASLLTIGWRPVSLIVAETIFLAGIVVAAILWRF